MNQTIEATVDKEGNVRLLEAVHLTKKHRALVMILDDLDDRSVDDRTLEAGYHEMSRDDARETEAMEWAEMSVEDLHDEAR